MDYFKFIAKVRFLSDWIEIKTVGNVDTAITNAENRMVWTQVLKNSRLCDNYKCLFKRILNKDKAFLTWVDQREIYEDLTSVKDYICCPKHNIYDEAQDDFEISSDNLNDHFDSASDRDKASYSQETIDDDNVSFIDSKFTDKVIVAELLKRSLQNIHSEILFLIASVSDLGNKMKICVDNLAEGDSPSHNLFVAEMCKMTVEASRLTTTAAGRFSGLTNSLLMSTFDDYNDNLTVSLLSSSSNYSTTYVGIGRIDSWSKMEDLYLISLYKSYGDDILTMTAHFNVRYSMFL